MTNIYFPGEEVTVNDLYFCAIWWSVLPVS